MRRGGSGGPVEGRRPDGLPAWRAPQIRHRWREFQRLRVAFFSEGGLTLDLPQHAGAKGALLARTFIQPDGDVLWFVDEAEVVAQLPLLRAHLVAVREHYRSGARAVSAVAAGLRMVRGALTGVSGLAVGLETAPTWGWWAAAAALLVVSVVHPVVRASTGWLLRRGLTARLA